MARWEALDGAISSLQLAITNQDLPTRLLSQGQPPSLPDFTLLSRHLLPDATRHILSTLGSNHLPITVFLSSHAQPSPRNALSFTNFLKDDWEGFTAESEKRIAVTPQLTSCSAGEKVPAYSRRRRDTISPAVMLGITAALSLMLWDTSSRREISAALMTPSTLPSCCWTETSSVTFAGKHKTSGRPSWSPLTTPPIPSTTGLFCVS